MNLPNYFVYQTNSILELDAIGTERERTLVEAIIILRGAEKRPFLKILSLSFMV